VATGLRTGPNHRRPTLGNLVLLGLAVHLTGGCSGDNPNAYVAPPPPEVIVAKPELRAVTTYLHYTGVVEASETVELRARVQGFLEKVNFQPGQRVKTGDLLFVIDQREYQAIVNQNKAKVDAAKAAFDLAVTTLERAQEAFDRGGTSDLELREKKAERDEAQAAHDLANANLAQAQLNLDFCEIRSPMEGRITRNLVDVGNLVGKGESTLLAQIVQTTPCYVPVDVSESDVLAVRRELEKAGKLSANEPGQIGPGQWRPCELAFTDQTEFKISGRVDYVEPEINKETGTLRVRTRFENQDEALLAGYFTRLRFPQSTREAMLVPEAALMTDQQGRYALIVNAKDEVEVRRVSISALDGTSRIVEEGLSADDRVIVLGVLKARPGAKVTPKVQEAAAASN